MVIVNKVQSFLKRQLKEHKVTRKDFAINSTIPYTTVNKLINAVQANPELKTLIKIAKYFNCSIDEILKRKDCLTVEGQEFLDLSLEKININLKNFINSELEKNKLNAYQLSKEIKCSENALFEFVNTADAKKTLSSTTVIALADYFKISIDKMIGRVQK